MQSVAARSLSSGLLSRWAVVLVIVLGLFSLMSVLQSDADAPPWLGMRAAYVGDGLRVTWVQPAGWAWDAGVRPGDLVQHVDGASQADPGDLNDATLVDVVSSQTGETLTVPDGAVNVPQSPFERMSLLVIAAMFVALGAVVF